MQVGSVHAAICFNFENCYRHPHPAFKLSRRPALFRGGTPAAGIGLELQKNILWLSQGIFFWALQGYAHKYPVLHIYQHMDQSSTAEEVWIPILFSNSICESMAQFRRIRPDRLTTSYPGVAQLVARLLWEREARVRATAHGKPGKPWDTWADSTFHLAGNWSKIGVDHMFDHNWKIS